MMKKLFILTSVLSLALVTDAYARYNSSSVTDNREMDIRSNGKRVHLGKAHETQGGKKRSSKKQSSMKSKKHQSKKHHGKKSNAQLDSYDAEMGAGNKKRAGKEVKNRPGAAHQRVSKKTGHVTSVGDASDPEVRNIDDECEVEMFLYEPNLN